MIQHHHHHYHHHLNILLQFLDNVSQLVDLSVLMRKWCLVLCDSSLQHCNIETLQHSFLIFQGIGGVPAYILNSWGPM